MCASVLLPEPLGPMIAWTSPALTVRSMPRRISLPSTLACRFLMTSIQTLSLRRRRGESALEAVGVGDVVDRYFRQIVGDEALNVLPDRALRADPAIAAVLLALLEAIHEHERPLDRLVDFFERDRSEERRVGKE